MNAADFKGLCALHGGMAEALVARPDVCADLVDMMCHGLELPADDASLVRSINWVQQEGFTVVLNAEPPPDR